MEEALENGDFEKAFIELKACIRRTSPEDRKQLLAHHKVKGKPTFHHLACFELREADIPFLDRLIKLFKKCGYDMDNTVSPVKFNFLNPAVNALCASIHAKNRSFFQCLLKNGAKPDARNSEGYSACQVAIYVGDLESLETMVFVGDPIILATTPDEKLGKNNIHPLLHTAVDNDRPDILAYLLSEDFGLDVNESSVYNNTQYTALDRVVSKGYRNSEVVGILLKALCQESKFSELFSRLVEGDTEAACTLLEKFSPGELAEGKIGDRWALHCLHPSAFEEKLRVEFTKKLISHYIRCGWDVNAESDSILELKLNSVDGHGCTFDVIAKVSRFTLLHVASISGSRPEMIKWLVETARAEVNCKTEGKVELTPVLILMWRQQWDSAGYLIEKGADLNIRGNFDGRRNFSDFMKRNLTTDAWEPVSSLNPVELLLRFGYETEFGGRTDRIKLLNKILATSTYIWKGAAEFHLAIEGSDLRFVSKVLQKCDGLIRNDALKWMEYCGDGGARELVPSIYALLRGLQFAGRNPFVDEQDVRTLTNLIASTLSAGPEINFQWERKCIFSVFALNFSWNSTEILVLLKTLLNIQNLRLNSIENMASPFQVLRGQLADACSNPQSCCVSRPNDPLQFWPVKATMLLITHGLDLSEEVIDANFEFHAGYLKMFKMIFAAGAKASQDFMDGETLCPFANWKLRKEFDELKKWKTDFDLNEACSLRHLCRLRVRKTLKCIKDLEKLDGEANEIQEYILLRDDSKPK